MGSLVLRVHQRIAFEFRGRSDDLVEVVETWTVVIPGVGFSTDSRPSGWIEKPCDVSTGLHALMFFAFVCDK